MMTIGSPLRSIFVSKSYHINVILQKDRIIAFPIPSLSCLLALGMLMAFVWCGYDLFGFSVAPAGGDFAAVGGAV